MPDILQILGIKPRSEVGAYGPGGRSMPSLDIPGTEKSFAPLAFLQTVTDLIEPEKGGALAAKGAGAKLAALLGIGVPLRSRSSMNADMVEIPLRLGSKAGDVFETQASLWIPDKSPFASLDALGDFDWDVEKFAGKSAVSPTTGMLGPKGLHQLGRYIADLLPKKRWLEFYRAGGRKGAQTMPDRIGGLDLQAIREGEHPLKALVRRRGTRERPLTDRELEFASDVMKWSKEEL